MPAHTITPLSPCSQCWHQQTSHPHVMRPGIVKTGIHLWRAYFSSVPVDIEGEHFPIEVGLRHQTAVRLRPWWGRRACRWASMKQFLTVFAEILRLCKPTVSSAVRVAGLRQCRRRRSCMWRSWTDVVTRGLRLWGLLDVLPNSIKPRWRWLFVEKLTFNSLATALVDIPAVSMPIACSLNLRHLWHCVVTTAHFFGLL